MSDWLGVLMSLLVIVVPLALAWWWVARGSPPEEGVREARRGKMRR